MADLIHDKVRDIIVEVIREYNRYRVPEVEARLLEFNGRDIVVEFKGSFCYTCGFYDYFDDFALELEDRGVKVERVSVEERLSEERAIVRFRIVSVRGL